MAVLNIAKVVGALPGTLAPDTIYAVRAGDGFDLYVSDATGSVAHRINYPARAGVPLGRWEGSAVASLPADNVFDDAIYSHYTITGQFRPATNGVNFTAVLRTGAGADVGGGLRAGGMRMQIGGAGGNVVSDQAILLPSSSNLSAGAIKTFSMHLHMRSGVNHGFDTFAIYHNSNGNTYTQTIGGEFIDTTPRQGIKFSFASGNIASGWFEIVGHLKQS